MSVSLTPRRIALLAVAGALLSVSAAEPQQPGRPAPRLEAVAETRLIMEGLAQSNLRGAERLLRQRPTDVETWTFIRGQALLLAETGNLLMLRPPRNQGQPAWMDQATDLRLAATRLGRSAAAQDFRQARLDLVAIANTCNSCHQQFRVPVQVRLFDPE